MSFVSADRYFDPAAAARVAQLRLAQDWAEEGRVYAAMSLYAGLLSRYPDSGIADAAAEGLLELADQFHQEGHNYAALKVYRKIEDLT